jgi:hypothetical protein
MFDRLAGTGAGGRRALAEAEDHLRAGAEEGVTNGLTPEEAQRAAVARFGPRIATAFRLSHAGPGALLRPAFTGTWLIGGVSLVAIGLSGVVAYAFGRLFGIAFVPGDSAGVTYTPERCADFAEYHPEAASCAAAAAAHHFDEVVGYRWPAGLLGLLALAALWVGRRWTPLGGPAWTPPAGMLAAVAVAIFGIGGLLLLGPTLLGAMFGAGDGLGADLSAGLVSGTLALAVASWAFVRARSQRAT